MSKQTSSSEILESVSDAIVEVTERVSRSVVQVGAGRWRGGTGTVWSKDGHIVTSNHVIGEMREVEVGFSDGTKHTAKVVGKDPYSDLALLKVDSDNLTAIETGNSDGLKVGQFVLAVANPFGRQPSATSGIVTNPAFSTRRWWGGGGLDNVIVKLDGKPVETLADLRGLLDDKGIGRHVNISVLRGEKLTQLTITPTEAEQD